MHIQTTNFLTAAITAGIAWAIHKWRHSVFTTYLLLGNVHKRRHPIFTWSWWSLTSLLLDIESPTSSPTKIAVHKWRHRISSLPQTVASLQLVDSAWGLPRLRDLPIVAFRCLLNNNNDKNNNSSNIKMNKYLFCHIFTCKNISIKTGELFCFLFSIFVDNEICLTSSQIFFQNLNFWKQHFFHKQLFFFDKMK